METPMNPTPLRRLGLPVLAALLSTLLAGSAYLWYHWGGAVGQAWLDGAALFICH